MAALKILGLWLTVLVLLSISPPHDPRHETLVLGNVACASVHIPTVIGDYSGIKYPMPPLPTGTTNGGIFTIPNHDWKYWESGPGKTRPLYGEAFELATCIQDDIGNSFIVTGGSEITGHMEDSKHYTGQALDIEESGLDKQRVFSAAKACGAKYIYDAGGHWHFQTT